MYFFFLFFFSYHLQVFIVYVLHFYTPVSNKMASANSTDPDQTSEAD